MPHVDETVRPCLNDPTQTSGGGGGQTKETEDKKGETTEEQ